MTLAEYIEKYMKDYGLTARQFASKCGLSHGIINKILWREPNHEPKIETINKIAIFTGANLYSLIKMAYPDIVSENELSGEAEIVAQAFEHASQEVKDIIRSLVRPK